MATTVARLEAILSADTRVFNRNLDRADSKMSKTGKAAGVMGAAIFAGLAVVAKRGFDELASQQKTMAQTEAVLKSTGGVAKVSAKQITDLAEALSQVSGVDDEVIQGGQNMLLTFTRIHNEAGRGNDIFNQATKATLDLSVAMGKDLNSSAILVGKALNDPIGGMTALKRVGVQLTDSQKALIEKLVESGDTMGAQKVILAELNTEFGGSAKAAGETLPMQLAKARNAFDDMAAKLLVMVLPAMTKMVEKLTAAVEWLQKHPGVLKLVVIGLGALAVALTAASVAQLALNLALFANPIGLVILAIAALAAGILVAYNKSEDFRTAVDALWEVFKNVTPIGLAIKHFDTLRDIAVKIWSVLGSIIGRIKAMIEWIKKIDFPKIPDLTPGFNLGGGGKGVSGGLQGAIRAGSEMGLRVSSLFRPGDPGDHGKGKAVDMAGSASAMERFAGSLFGSGKDVIYGGLGYWQDNGRMVPNWVGNEGLRAGHRDHVHYSVFDKGGWLMPGLTLAANNTGRPERVGGGNVVINFPNYVGSKSELMAWLQNASAEFQRRNGRPLLGT